MPGMVSLRVDTPWPVSAGQGDLLLDGGGGTRTHKPGKAAVLETAVFASFTTPPKKSHLWLENVVGLWYNRKSLAGLTFV